MKIYTVGYEGLDIDSFLSLLADNDIETVVDPGHLATVPVGGGADHDR